MAELTPGTVVGGKYRLEAPIGQGGMASVWRATHTALGSSVAVKLLESFGAGRARMKRRFVREAKLAANLTHRNVVHILDYGMMEDGQPFMVMELLEGQSLAERFESEGPALTDLEVLDIGAELLGGLAAVHDAGIVHRDVKPENVFLVRDADGVYPKLLDFGISRSLADGDEARMTNTGMVVGTPLYMSPEQARGLKDIDPLTDLWSVGIILYEALTGGVPFESENMGDILIKVATETVPPLQAERPDLPEVLVNAVMRALEKDRSKRWQDARAMRDALVMAADQLARGQTVVPRIGRRSASSQKVPLAMSTSGAPWEEADTAIDPEAVAQAPLPEAAHPTEQVRKPPAGAQRWWPVLAAAAVLGLGAIGFVALGGEIRFRAPSGAEPETESTPTPAAARAPAPVEEAGGAVASDALPVGAEDPVADAPNAGGLEASGGGTGSPPQERPAEPTQEPPAAAARPNERRGSAGAPPAEADPAAEEPTEVAPAELLGHATEVGRAATGELLDAPRSSRRRRAAPAPSPTVEPLEPLRQAGDGFRRTLDY